MNILLTNNCNRGCRYCFAIERISHTGAQSAEGSSPAAKAEITPDNFLKAVRFAKADGQRSVGILGGEPSLHSQFTTLLNMCWDEGMQTRVFTNGLWREEDIETLAAADKKYHRMIHLVVNVNQPDETSEQEKMRQEHFLKTLSAFASISFNIYREDFDPLFLVDLIKRCGTRKNIRLGIAEPLAELSSNHVDIGRYKMIAPTIVKLAQACDQEDISIGFDCGFTLCMFTEEQIGRLILANVRFVSSCSAVVDIGTDLSAWACFPLSTFSRGVNMEEFAALKDLVDHFNRQFRRLYRSGALDECVDCRYRRRNQCRGGCAAHVYRRFHP